ncbi:peptide-methionine (S)-S-oxide reductase MsrA [Niveibacterium umoris]|uniref:Peptide methionine sulfoxide reductase MsrA n=1 Tax=Niveibacterium umoris TaxID=1193620 RepID=A0A840BPG5_9RHOO|nr:peptide-methionine (S)-S-oxide reductase MsrA [Niveibacterium umoris]MBB4014544.1 peptide-methionine (S)-S-oxide reductase [Niveibacterium umoris]
MTQGSNTHTAVFGGGCFWCLEAVFEQIRGVQAVTSGYCGGHLPDPTYEAVCSGRSGHVEVVRVEYDPDQIGYRDLVEVFFAIHDPTTPNRQGNDVGPQYRSAIVCNDAQQRSIALEVIEELREAAVFAAPIVTELLDATRFYPAETYHQGYFRGHETQPYCAYVVAPKLAKFRKKFASLLR